ncbi:LD-carboxypeptidase [Ancylothrix sp. C2]|uniref:S66 peptidase family protein n=1 Tax=Ancylothrix sp. D3o TaxID=2953691 RepID=UPI0021BAD47B|nr:LD-carboxypeptidase [Ancylothrix sp. D3o]MCT7950356.1 LD-carboxypeptidase [Ancylothrix sp. D3o]
MRFSRRNFLRGFGLTILASTSPALCQTQPVLKPARLKVGDTVGLINPATFSEPKEIEDLRKTLSQFGLNVKLGKHLFDRYGYLAGRDAERAADVNAMFGDTSVNAILAVQGGWGCNRILPLLDYKLIRGNSKILMGYSDITSLLLAVYSQSGIVTFHGPLGASTWNDFSLGWVRQILFGGEAVMLRNPIEGVSRLDRKKMQPPLRVETITAGKARGKLVGGNLSVLAAMVGSNYLPSWEGVILFVEDIGEEVYRVDRLLTQLKLAGILNNISGFIFGQCTDCDPENPLESLSLSQVFLDIIKPLGVPAWYGAAIGHIADKWTVPVGVEVEIDASVGTVQFLEPAVV